MCEQLTGCRKSCLQIILAAGQRLVMAPLQVWAICCAGSEMLLADDIECFWLAGPSSSGTSDQAATPSQLDRTYSHGSSALSRSASLAQSVSRHPSTSEGGPGLFTATAAFSSSLSGSAMHCLATDTHACMVLQRQATHCHALSNQL